MYTLLTGATGLLGRYLMRDLLLRGRNLAVLVRPSRRESAVERVDAVLSYWEQVWQRSLTRPVVLSGDITQAGLGLSQPDRRWLSANCREILHSAASLTFYEEDGEPWRSNVQGVRHVLDICQELHIRRLYHVSTAYTCGLRDGTVFEHELDVGQQFGNDYERSKVQAEQLVRAADHLDLATVFRPSIIVGDALTGFTSTFHGFYTPLRLVCALQTQLSHEQVFDTDYMKLMGLNGNEGKNFIPVNWVSQAMVSVMERVPDSSRTYALVSQAPVTSARMFEIIRAVSRKQGGTHAAAASNSLIEPEALPTDPVLAAYLEQLHTYRSYWRNDPDFDCTNTSAVLPDLPCPILTDELLMRLAEWAVQSKFSVPLRSPRRAKAPGLIQADERALPKDSGIATENARVLTITGLGGGSWTFQANQAGRMSCCSGRLEGAPELCIGREAFARIVNEQASLDEVARAGKLVMIGPRCELPFWQEVFAAARSQALVTSGP